MGLLTVAVNFVLMAVKILAGTLGNSYALIADGIESAADILTSLVTWSAFHLSLRPPDDDHPFGHGKIESLAGIFSGIALIGAAAAIAFQSIREILTPHHSPEWFTLPILIAVIITKELLSRKILSLAGSIDSRALEGDAWHHRSDAITSAAAATGISIALIGGEKWAVADDIAALAACGVILFTAIQILKRSLHDTMDGCVDPKLTEKIASLAAEVDSVHCIEKCLLRKSGIHYFAELHVQVDENLPVSSGHRIAHDVKKHLIENYPSLRDVSIHVEPFDVPSKTG